VNAHPYKGGNIKEMLWEVKFRLPYLRQKYFDYCHENMNALISKDHFPIKSYVIALA